MPVAFNNTAAQQVQARRDHSRSMTVAHKANGTFRWKTLDQTGQIETIAAGTRTQDCYINAGKR